MFIVLVLMTSAAAFPQNSPSRIEAQAPPIPIAFAPPYVPAPIYGALPVPAEQSSSSILTTQSPAPTPPVQPEGSLSSPAPVLDDRVPIRQSEGMTDVPDNWVAIPKGSNQIVLAPGTIISLRDKWGQFSHGFSDRSGTAVSEQGILNTNDDAESVIVKRGFYSYISPEGTRITVSYVADENGFSAKGDHIPS
ncbi:endocuticle structural glycoprotein SgAbd-1 isoform X1 [Cryptotermes secundus]|uniref:endocuticle structural glycoprotein SgAbd-1 isoform X1 n=1 Tax=Cryptotermes secundus TaxID=105785 RepID=UPI000CD7BEBA|nr:endocuticle structural glycoprotein SgAbd-1 isoform X1 [Cryptotermes secundus]